MCLTSRITTPTNGLSFSSVEWEYYSHITMCGKDDRREHIESIQLGAWLPGGRKEKWYFSSSCAPEDVKVSGFFTSSVCGI